MMVLVSFILSYEKILHAQKEQNAQKAQKVTFFILDVLFTQKAQKAQDFKQAASSSLMFLCAQKCCLLCFYSLMCVLCFLCQTIDFLPLRCFLCAFKLLLFLFAYVRFMLFVRVGSSCKKV